MKSTLDIMPQAGRAVGNSTRQIDYAIRILFHTGVIEVADHTNEGTNLKENRMLLKKIHKRIKSEHPHAKMYHVLFTNNRFNLFLR